MIVYKSVSSKDSSYGWCVLTSQWLFVQIKLLLNAEYQILESIMDKAFFFTPVSEWESDNNYEMGAGMKVLLTRECGLDYGF